MEFLPADFESLPCDYCLSTKATKRYDKRGFNIVQCNECGMVYTNPRLREEKINELYDADYFQGHGFDKSVNYVADVTAHEKHASDYDLHDWDVDTISQILGSKGPGPATLSPSMLEIGCGTGVFLDKARKHGFRCEGLELSSYAANFVRDMGIEVQIGSIDSADYAPESWDVIVMREVIEHLPHPLESLRTVYKWLKPGGMLFMATGNYDCPERKLKGSDWFYFMPEGHLYYFSNKTMTKYLKKVGFRKVRVTNQGDMLMQKLLDLKIISPGKHAPKDPFRRIAFQTVRTINHFISSGMRIYAVK